MYLTSVHTMQMCENSNKNGVTDKESRARADNGSLGAVPPVGPRGRAPAWSGV